MEQAAAMVADLPAQQWIIILRRLESMKFTMCSVESCTNMEVAIFLLLKLVCIAVKVNHSISSFICLY